MNFENEGLEARLREACFQGDIATSASTLAQYSRDASLLRMTPALVVYPRNSADIGILVRCVGKLRDEGRDVSLTVRSGGTDMTGGPLTHSIVVDMTRHFTNVRSVEVVGDGGIAVVEPGVFYRDFEKETLAKGLLMPSFPASREICTVGGMVANNAGGELALAYGKTARYVQELKVVLDDGNEYVVRPLSKHEFEGKKALRTVEGQLYRKIAELIELNTHVIAENKPTVEKNSSGYALWDVVDTERGVFDITKLLVGSQGTLGIITEITFALVRPKKYAELVVFFLKDITEVAELANRLLPLKPQSIESYDNHTFSLAFKIFPQIARRLGTGLFRLGWSFLPEIGAVLKGGIPKLVVLAEFAGDSDADVHARAEKAVAMVSDLRMSARVIASPHEAEKYWIIRRESFNLLRQRVRGMRTAPFIEDVVVASENLPEFLPKLYHVLDQYDLLYTVAGHVGEGNFHIIPLVDPTRKDLPKLISSVSKDVFALVKQYRGSISGEHNDGLIHTPYLSYMFSEPMLNLFDVTKKIFDPKSIFNPGKKTGVTEKEMLTFLDLPTNS